MIKKAKVSQRDLVRLPDTFRPTIQQLNNGDAAVDIHFGSNLDVLVLVAHNKQLSKDNQERIRILTEVR